LEYFFLGMIAFPEIQRKAQAEIDQVIGAGRLPGFQDRRNLPYIDAVVKELLRWHPAARMGLPHTTTEDDICDGYLIPKGALLLPNVWCVALSYFPRYFYMLTVGAQRYFAHDPEV
jgi:cytochrome P450